MHDQYDSTWTHGELRARANQVAHVLLEDQGIVPGNRVIIRGSNNPWQVALRLGVLKAGAVVVTSSPLFRHHEIANVINLVHPSLIISDYCFADDAFGFGVVFSDETLSGIANADPVFAELMTTRFARWSDIDVTYKGQTISVGGQGFAAMSRKEMLEMLQQRARSLGITVHYSTLAPPVDELQANYDLVLAADGLNSLMRNAYPEAFGPDLDLRPNKYMWLGTDRIFEAFEFFIKETEWGVMQVHAYPFSVDGSTFIVEMHEDVWRRAGFDATEDHQFVRGESDEWAVDKLREIFAEELDGHELLTNNSRWINFTTVRNRT